MPLATLAAHAALEVPAKNVSVTPMALCLSPVTQSQGSARAAQEPREGSVMAASTGMHARPRSVFVCTLTYLLVLGPGYQVCPLSSEQDHLFLFALASATHSF